MLREISEVRKTLVNHLPLPAQLMLPFLLAGFLSVPFTVWPCFIQGGKAPDKVVGLWVHLIHSPGTLLFSPVEVPAVRERHETMS